MKTKTPCTPSHNHLTWANIPATLRSLK